MGRVADVLVCLLPNTGSKRAWDRAAEGRLARPFFVCASKRSSGRQPSGARVARNERFDPGFDLAAALSGAFAIAVGGTGTTGNGPDGGDGRAGQSQVGQVLLVDVEFGGASGAGAIGAGAIGGGAGAVTGSPGARARKSHAVFLSPAMARSRHHGKALEDLVARMVAACHAYDHVHFFTAQRREARAVEALTQSWDRLGWIPLDVIVLGEGGVAEPAPSLQELEEELEAIQQQGPTMDGGTDEVDEVISLGPGDLTPR